MTKQKQRKKMVIVLTRGQLEDLNKLMKGTGALIMDLEVMNNDQVTWLGETDVNRRKE